MITEYAVPSWAPNHHCKKYQLIYESVFSYLCTCMRNKYSCMKCPHTSNVEGDQYFNSQQAWACWDMVARGIVFKFPDWQSNIHFPWPNELTICADINGSKFQSKLCVPDTDDVKQKTSLFSVQGKSAWYVFMVLCSFVLYVICACYTK